MMAAENATTEEDNASPSPSPFSSLPYLEKITPRAPPDTRGGKIIMRSARGDNSVGSSTLVGASLLCFAVDPKWSRIYFLLGKERKNNMWRAGSDKWSDLGGKVSSDAPTAEETAAKEFLEESLAMVRYFETDVVPRQQYDDIAASLHRQEFVFKLKLTFGTVENAKHYVTFVKQIPWDPGVVTRFDTCRKMLLHPRTHSKSEEWTRLVSLNPSVHYINNYINTHRRDRHADAHADDWVSGIASTKQGRKKSRSRCRLHGKPQGRGAGNAPPNSETGECTGNNDHSSSTNDHSSCCHLLIREEFMEKQMLGFWSIPQLQHAVETHGILFKRDGKIERCRASFTAVIELVMSELRFVLPELINENSYNNTKT